MKFKVKSVPRATYLIITAVVALATGTWIGHEYRNYSWPVLEGQTAVALAGLGLAALSLWNTRRERRASLRSELYKRRLDLSIEFIKAAEKIHTEYGMLRRPLPDHRERNRPAISESLKWPTRGSEEWWQEERETKRLLYQFQEALHPLSVVFPNEQLNAAGRVCTAAAYWRETILGEEGRKDEMMDPTNTGIYQFGNALYDLMNTLRAFNGLEALTSEIGKLVGARKPSEEPMYSDPFSARRTQQRPQRDLDHAADE